MSTKKLQTVLLYVVIFSGGFGIVRMVFVPHDPTGTLAIALSLVLTWAYIRRAKSIHFNARRNIFASERKRPVSLASKARESFEVFLGRPAGYAGYTDYNAMSCGINDDLSGRQPEQQYALLGFGSGFLEAILSRLANGTSDCRVHLHVTYSSQTSKESIGWLVHHQRFGTDNADQSTENLQTVIRAISQEVLANGPITMNFWDKVHNKLSENLDSSGTSLEILGEWTKVYEAFHQVGQRLGEGAIVDAEPVMQV